MMSRSKARKPAMISKWTIDLPPSIQSALAQGDKKWEVVLSIRQFGSSSTSGNINIPDPMKKNDRQKRDSASLINKGAYPSLPKSKKGKQSKPAQPKAAHTKSPSVPHSVKAAAFGQGKSRSAKRRRRMREKADAGTGWSDSSVKPTSDQLRTDAESRRQNRLADQARSEL